jgi:hypothetical protein
LERPAWKLKAGGRRDEDKRDTKLPPFTQLLETLLFEAVYKFLIPGGMTIG